MFVSLSSTTTVYLPSRPTPTEPVLSQCSLHTGSFLSSSSDKSRLSSQSWLLLSSSSGLHSFQCVYCMMVIIMTFFSIIEGCGLMGGVTLIAFWIIAMSSKRASVAAMSKRS